jgi:hypothetical protein
MHIAHTGTVRAVLAFEEVAVCNQSTLLGLHSSIFLFGLPPHSVIYHHIIIIIITITINPTAPQSRARPIVSSS